MRMKGRYAWLVGAALIIAVAGMPAAVWSGPACTVKVGVATDFTGGAALVGEGQRKGTYVAAEEINRNRMAGSCRLVLAFAGGLALPAIGLHLIG